MYLGQIRNRYEKIKDLNAEILAVCFYDVDALARYKTKTKTPFPLLADVGSKVIKMYDITNSWDPFHTNVSHPATYIIDKQGIIRFAEVRQNYLFRTKIKTILEELKKLA